MGNGIVDVQRLELHEGSRLRDIRLRALRDAPDAFGSTYAEIAPLPPEAWREQLRELASYVAVVDGRDVGMARGGSDSDDRRKAWLLSMWVEGDQRGCGVGGALVSAVIDWARSEGHSSVLLDVGDFNDPAIKLYERYGFVENGKVSALGGERGHITERQLELVLA